MKDLYTVTGEIQKLKRMRSSANGNPRYEVWLLTDGGIIDIFYTGIDSSHGYGIDNYYCKRVEVEIGTHRNVLTLNDIKGLWDEESKKASSKLLWITKKMAKKGNG